MQLSYFEQGRPDAPAVLMLHGYADSGFSFSRVLPLLSPDLRVIVPDQRGHGGSARPSAGYSIDDFATDAIQLLDQLGVSRAVLVGHSMGSFVARRVAERAPHRVARLVLVGAAPTARNTVLEELQGVVDALADPVDAGFVREFQSSTVHRQVPPAFLEQVVSNSRAVPVHVWQSALAGLLDYVPSDRPILCPTAVIGGDHDAVFSPDEQKALAGQIPGALLHLVGGVGHALHWEDPERFVELLRA